MFLNAIFFICFGINMEKKSILLCKWEKQILFDTWGQGRYLFVQIAEIRQMKTRSRHTSFHKYWIQHWPWVKYWVKRCIMMIKNGRWGGEKAYGDTCYHSFSFFSDVACTKPLSPWNFIVLSLQKKTHLSNWCVCWHMSIGTLVTNCTALRSSFPLKSRYFF